MKWGQKNVIDPMTWTWEKTGEQYGSKGQIILICLVGAIAYKCLGHLRHPRQDQKEPRVVYVMPYAHSQQTLPFGSSSS